MIKIFSIKEILDASNNILNREKIKNKSTQPSQSFKLNINRAKNKLTDIETNKSTLKYTKNIEENTELSSHSKIIDKEPLILKDDLNENKNNNPKTEKHTSEDLIETKKEIIDDLYKLLKEKIRKNTLKIILDQQLENKKLKNIVSDIRKKEFLNLKLNKKLKDEISNLKNNEKILNFKISNFEKELKKATEKEFELSNSNRKLENDNFELKNSIRSFNETFKI